MSFHVHDTVEGAVFVRENGQGLAESAR